MSGPRVVFMCGPSGSGKSTYAKGLEEQGWVRLSFDVEAWRRGITEVPMPRELALEIEQDLRARLLTLVAEGAEVVLDFAFATREVRDEYRALLAPTGVVAETVFLATDRAVVMERLSRRSGAHADDPVLTDEIAARHFDHFEIPTPDEGPLQIVRDGWS